MMLENENKNICGVHLYRLKKKAAPQEHPT